MRQIVSQSAPNPVFISGAQCVCFELTCACEMKFELCPKAIITMLEILPNQGKLMIGLHCTWVSSKQ